LCRWKGIAPLPPAVDGITSICRLPHSADGIPTTVMSSSQSDNCLKKKLMTCQTGICAQLWYRRSAYYSQKNRTSLPRRQHPFEFIPRLAWPWDTFFRNVSIILPHYIVSHSVSQYRLFMRYAVRCSHYIKGRIGATTTVQATRCLTTAPLRW
jgi:hypothetical protein